MSEYHFSPSEYTAAYDRTTFSRFADGDIMAAEGARQISMHNRQEMTEEQFLHYFKALGYFKTRG